MGIGSGDSFLISFKHEDTIYKAKIHVMNGTEKEILYKIELEDAGEIYHLYLNENAQWTEKELGNSDLISAIGNEIENTFA